jgi:membrane fusion protein (multidrug efflux system)
LETKVKEVDASLAYSSEARTMADSAVAEAAGARAGVDEAKAAVALAELQLSYTQVVAPEDGFVTSKAVEAGDYVQTGQSLLEMVPREVWVTANFKETQITDMHPGEPATIEVDAYPGRQLRGRVDSIQAGSGARFSLLPPENATGNFVKVVQRVPVKIVFDQELDGNHVLGPGMSAVPDVRVRAGAVQALVVTVLAAVLIVALIGAALVWMRKSRGGG